MGRRILVAAVLVLTFLGGGLLLRRGTPGTAGEDPESSPRLFDQVVSHVRRYAVDSLDDNALYQKAAEGILAELPDPYAALLVGSDQATLAGQTSGNYGGIGVQADLRGGTILVVSAWPDSPADRAGIRTGDRIVEVDGRVVGPADLTETARLLRGEPGTTVLVRVRRNLVDGLLTFRVRRAEVHRRSVSSGILYDDGIGYVALTRVVERSALELQQAVDSLRGLGMRSLVLDLRGNPGGLLAEGVALADLFLPPGQAILETRGRTASVQQRYVDQRPELWTDLPLAILVNEGTASAAEIIAGALQDHDRALVVGQPTYGKGLVQSVFTLREGATLRLTTGRWYTPSGRTIQRPERATTPTTATLPADSLPAFRTDGGRVVRGGGGIIPDVVVRRDSLPPAERAFLDGLGRRIPAYRNAVTSVALRVRDRGTITSADFSISPLLRAELLAELGEAGIAVNLAGSPAAQAVLERDLGHEIARYSLGRPAELRRRSRLDRQLQAAFAALRAAPTRLALLGIDQRADSAERP
jgi:carboxyl-terminal processing protease